MMNCFCGMVDQWKTFSLISNQDHCQRSSQSQISNMPQIGFEPAPNLISGFVEWSCAVVITTMPQRNYTTSIGIVFCCRFTVIYNSRLLSKHFCLPPFLPKMQFLYCLLSSVATWGDSRVFQIAVRSVGGGGIPPQWGRESEILLGDFFTGWWEPEEIFWSIIPFSKLKIAFCE